MRGARAKEIRRRCGHSSERRQYVCLGNMGGRKRIYYNHTGTVINNPESPRAIYLECKKLYKQGDYKFIR
jgi:hypothetical protein